MSTVNPLFMKWFNTHNIFVDSKASKPLFFVKKKSLQKLLYLKGGVDLVQSWHIIIL